MIKYYFNVFEYYLLIVLELMFVILKECLEMKCVK